MRTPVRGAAFSRSGHFSSCPVSIHVCSVSGVIGPSWQIRNSACCSRMRTFPAFRTCSRTLKTTRPSTVATCATWCESASRRDDSRKRRYRKAAHQPPARIAGHVSALSASESKDATRSTRAASGLGLPTASAPVGRGGLIDTPATRGHALRGAWARGDSGGVECLEPAQSPRSRRTVRRPSRSATSTGRLRRLARGVPEAGGGTRWADARALRRRG